MLKTHFITGKNINLRNVTTEDAHFILSLRLNEKLNLYISKTSDEVKKQIEWIRNYQEKNNEWYFIIESKKNDLLGTIRIYDVIDEDESFEWGSWIVKPEAPSYASIESMLLIYEYAFYVLGFQKARFTVRKLNKKVVDFQLHFGAKIISEDDENYYFCLLSTEYIIFKTKYQKYLPQEVL